MKEIIITDSDHAFAGFTSGSNGIWTRNSPDDPPTDDYTSLSRRLGIRLSNMVRPYQAGGDKVVIIGYEHGGAGIIKDNDLRKVDGLITAEKGLVLSIIAADCVPVYLNCKAAGVIGLLHCGWKSAAGSLLHNAVQRMKELGAVPDEINVAIGPHICKECYEVGDDVFSEYSKAFAPDDLKRLFTRHEERLYLSLSDTIRSKAAAEGIPDGNISCTDECTYHGSDYYSYRRGDRGLQNLAYIIKP